jgi:hypothetical protein
MGFSQGINVKIQMALAENHNSPLKQTRLHSVQAGFVFLWLKEKKNKYFGLVD